MQRSLYQGLTGRQNAVSSCILFLCQHVIQSADQAICMSGLQNRAVKPAGGWPVEEPVSTPEDESVKAMRIWSRYQAKDDSPIYDNFSGLTRSSITCHKCQSVTMSYEPCLDLSLPLAKEPKARLSTWFSSTNTCTTIVDCLQAFFGDEELQVISTSPFSSATPALFPLAKFRYPACSHAFVADAEFSSVMCAIMTHSLQHLQDAVLAEVNCQPCLKRPE